MPFQIANKIDQLLKTLPESCVTDLEVCEQPTHPLNDVQYRLYDSIVSSVEAHTCKTMSFTLREINLLATRGITVKQQRKPGVYDLVLGTSKGTITIY